MKKNVKEYSVKNYIDDILNWREEPGRRQMMTLDMLELIGIWFKYLDEEEDSDIIFHTCLRYMMSFEQKHIEHKLTYSAEVKELIWKFLEDLRKIRDK